MAPTVSGSSRRSFLVSALGGGAALGCASLRSVAAAEEPLAQGEGLALACRPVRVFKAEDPGGEDTESWCFNLLLEAPSEGPWRTEELELAYQSCGAVVIHSTIRGAALATIRTDLPGGRVPRWPFTLRIRGSAPRSARMESVVCRLTVTGPSGTAQTVETTIGLSTYQARTALCFPFHGHGVVTQGGASDGGHGNQSGQFAVDAIGLTPMYAPQLATGDENEAAAGWGRVIVAPAAGVVVRVRADRPDQPVTGKSDPAYMLPEFQGRGDPGNHVVIDHGNGEFSMLAHMQTDSVLVAEGQLLAAGEPIGRLGNSGDSTFPHLHYQLMDGPDWTVSDGLPYRFADMPARLVRGTWLEAK